MKKIIKTNPPEEFIEYCKTQGVSYDGLSGSAKRALRKRLLEDQGYICCYCGRRIEENEHTKIEHIKCQKNYNELSLDYDNMLVSCDGGEGDRANRVRPKHKLHCDAKKENKDIPISPLDNIEGLLTFFDDGTVKGTGLGIDLIRILGLDTEFLNTQRKNAIEHYDVLDECGLFPDSLQEECDFLREKHDGQFYEFCFVLEQLISDLILHKSSDPVILNYEVSDSSDEHVEVKEVLMAAGQ